MERGWVPVTRRHTGHSKIELFMKVIQRVADIATTPDQFMGVLYSDRSRWDSNLGRFVTHADVILFVCPVLTSNLA